MGDKIGYVSTGLREDEILRCLRKTKHAILGAISSRFSTEIDWKCSICQVSLCIPLKLMFWLCTKYEILFYNDCVFLFWQEEYEPGEEVGKMECSHSYHMSCIKQWLLQKNTCPVCKVSTAISQFWELWRKTLLFSFLLISLYRSLY